MGLVSPGKKKWHKSDFFFVFFLRPNVTGVLKSDFKSEPNQIRARCFVERVTSHFIRLPHNSSDRGGSHWKDGVCSSSDESFASRLISSLDDAATPLWSGRCKSQTLKVVHSRTKKKRRTDPNWKTCRVTGAISRRFINSDQFVHSFSGLSVLWDQ